MNEILKLCKGFYLKNKTIVLGTVIFGIVCSSLESIIIPNTIAGTFNSLGNDALKLENKELKYQLIKLVFAWILVKLSYSILNYFRKKIEPSITKYITIELIKLVFKKYEIENEFFNASVVLNKVTIIKKNIQDLFYIFCSVFVPRVIVIFLSFLNFYFIHKKLGLTVLVCLIIQFTTASVGLNSCIEMTFSEYENKDKVYEYIEDIFYNMDTLQSIPNSFDNEIEEILNITELSKEKEEKTYDCINYKQYKGYFINIIVFSIIIYQVFNMYKNNELSKEKVTKTILSLTGFFENIYEITYYIPEITYKIGILQNNEQFLHDLKLKKKEINCGDFIMENNIVEFKNVTFKYEKNNHILFKKFSMIFPENKIICLYGPSGTGKSSFIKLIFGSEKPTEGTIFIGGNDISKFTLSKFRKYISYISQNTTLFNKTLIENILYGYYTNDEIEENKEEFLNIIIHLFEKFKFYKIFENLDENKSKWSFLNKSVGKLGKNLSGGQKQLVSLLRITFNKYSKIVILDEPTSALDDDSRNSVLNFVKYLKEEQGKTIFIITHDSFYKELCYSSLQFFQDKNPELVV